MKAKSFTKDTKIEVVEAAVSVAVVVVVVSEAVVVAVVDSTEVGDGEGEGSEVVEVEDSGEAEGSTSSLAKKGASESQPDTDLTYGEKHTLTKSARKPVTPKDDYHCLTRQEQVILLRLRTGHNRLNAHMHRKFGLAP
nr:hypothetical protein BaRGS_009683 [Batillaria attramentaria]